MFRTCLLAVTILFGSSSSAMAQDDEGFVIPPADLVPGSTMRTHVLKQGESVESVAARWGLDAADVREWNDLEGPAEPGQKLVLWTPPGAEERPEPELVVQSMGESVPPGLTPDKADKTAPDVYKVSLQTSEGEVVIKVRREWAPHAADRFYNLVSMGFYDDTAFHRVVSNYLVQFGIHGNPAVNRAWREQKLEPDEGSRSNRPGYMAFAESEDGYPTTQVFINTNVNVSLDSKGYTPFGKVVKGMGTVKRLYDGYGDNRPMGEGPILRRASWEGSSYLEREFPELDYVKKATILD